MDAPPPRTVQIARILMFTCGLLVIGGSAFATTTVTTMARHSPALVLAGVITAVGLAAGLGHLLLAWRLGTPRIRASSLAFALLGTTAAIALAQQPKAVHAGHTYLVMVPASLLAVSVAAIVFLARRDSVAWHRADPPARVPRRPNAIVVTTVAMVAIGVSAGLVASARFLMALVSGPDTATFPVTDLLISLVMGFGLFLGPLALAASLWSGREKARIISLVLGGGAIGMVSSGQGAIVDPFFNLLLLVGGVTIIVALSRASSRAWCTGDIKDDSTG